MQREQHELTGEEGEEGRGQMRTNAKSLTKLQNLCSLPMLMCTVATKRCFSDPLTCAYAGCVSAPVTKASTATPWGDCKMP